MTEPATDILPAPEIPSLRHRLKYQRERAAFLRLLPELLQSDHGRYVAIHDEAIVARGQSMLETVQAAHAAVGYVTLFAGLVDENPQKPVRLPGFELRRR